MDKELIDRAWACLPREFKEEVKKDYKAATDSPKWDEAYNCALEETFGIHNLTSDAEGEEDEMLCVSRERVQDEYAIISKEPSRRDTDAEDYIAWNYAKMTFEELFGSKCLPDEEPKTAEPKFKVGDIAVVRGFKHPLFKQDGAIVTILSYHEKGDFYSCAIAPNVGIDVDAKHLKPYTEPEENMVESRKLSQETANCDKYHIGDANKMIDSIVKDGFREHNRLHVAATIAAGWLACHGMTSPETIAMDALTVADVLIRECEKGGSK